MLSPFGFFGVRFGNGLGKGCMQGLGCAKRQFDRRAGAGFQAGIEKVEGDCVIEKRVPGVISS